jgi:hypothetical protein
MQIENQEENSGQESNPYSLFLYAVRSAITRDYYLRRLRIFFNHINLLPNETMEVRCNQFASKGLEDQTWAFRSIIRFMQFQRERVEREEITAATLRNYVKAIKLFCEMCDIPIAWKKINRGLPKIRRFADDRAPTLEEIQRICEYPDRRIKGIVFTMASSGIRLGAWDYLRWGHMKPIKKDSRIVAAKILVYHGDDEEYFSFITAETYYHLDTWIKYRQDCGEKISDGSWVMRQLWNTKLGHYHHGMIKAPEKLKSSGVKRLIEDALWTQGIRKKSDLKRNRSDLSGGEKIEMMNGKYSEQEIININEIEQQLNSESQYITVAIGNSRILRFLTEKKIEEVEKTYNGQMIKKIRFIVTDPNEENKSEKYFDVGKRSARLIISKLKEGHTLLKIERIGSGKETLYIPTQISVN